MARVMAEHFLRNQVRQRQHYEAFREPFAELLAMPNEYFGGGALASRVELMRRGAAIKKARQPSDSLSFLLQQSGPAQRMLKLTLIAKDPDFSVAATERWAMATYEPDDPCIPRRPNADRDQRTLLKTTTTILYIIIALNDDNDNKDDNEMITMVDDTTKRTVSVGLTEFLRKHDARVTDPGVMLEDFVDDMI